MTADTSPGSGVEDPTRTDDADPERPPEADRRARGETEAEALDRNYDELLQELRVAQAGVQILFGFLLGLAFTPRFADLNGPQRTVYTASLLLSASAAAMMLAPAMYHRLVFRQQLKGHLVAATHRVAIGGLVLVLLAMVGAVHLVLSLVVPQWASVMAAVLGGGVALLWFLPPLLRRGSGEDGSYRLAE